MDSSGNTISSVQATDNLLYATDDSSIISSQISNDVRFGNLVRVPTSTQNYARGATTIMQQIDNSQSVTYQSGTGPFNIAKLIQNVTLNGKTTQITFDGVQKTIEEKSPLNNITRYELDDKERIKKVISPGFMDTDITYDSVGNISELKQGIRKTNFFYNNSGNLISEIDANNHETKFEYDNVGRLTKKTFPNGEYVGYEYTAGGALKKIRAPNGEYHEFQTGLLDQITSYLPPALSFGASSTTYNYDADGKLLNLQKPSGKFANYKYKTGTNFLEKIETSLGNYEFNGIDTVGRAAEITSPDGIKVRTMWVGDKISSIQWYDGGSHVGVINYSYNSDFQLSSTQIQSQPALSYNYDLEGKLTQAGEETYTYETQTNRGTVNDKYIISANYIVNGTLGAIKSRYATNARTDLVDQSVTKISDVNFLTPQLFGRSFQSTLNEDLVGNVTLQTELKYGLIPNPIEYKVQTWRDTSFGTIKHVLLRCWIQMAKLKSNMFMVHTV
jgi:YD repeat-containing protein